MRGVEKYFRKACTCLLISLTAPVCLAVWPERQNMSVKANEVRRNVVNRAIKQLVIQVQGVRAHGIPDSDTAGEDGLSTNRVRCPHTATRSTYWSRRLWLSTAGAVARGEPSTLKAVHSTLAAMHSPLFAAAERDPASWLQRMLL